MTAHDIVVLGLPGSGKTTFLAALWHLLTSDEVETRLSLVSLQAGESAHLNEIAALWRRARVQERTLHAGDRTVTVRASDWWRLTRLTTVWSSVMLSTRAPTSSGTPARFRSGSK